MKDLLDFQRSEDGSKLIFTSLLDQILGNETNPYDKIMNVQGLIYVCLGDKWGFVTREHKFIDEHDFNTLDGTALCLYPQLDLSNHIDLFQVALDFDCGYITIDENYKAWVKTRVKEKEISVGTIVCDHDKVGFKDREGVLQVPVEMECCEYDPDFHYLLVFKDGKYGCYVPDKRYVAPKYDALRSVFSEVYVILDGKKGKLLKNGKITKSSPYGPGLSLDRAGESLKERILKRIEDDIEYCDVDRINGEFIMDNIGNVTTIDCDGRYKLMKMKF